MIRPLAIYCTISSLALAASALAEPQSAPPEELPAAIEWFNHLTVADVAGKPYVEVVTQRYHAGGGKVREEKQRGFLIAEDEKSWTLVPDGTGSGDWFTRAEKLWPVRVDKPGTDQRIGARFFTNFTYNVVSAHKSPDKLVLDLRTVAAEVCAAVEASRGKGQSAGGGCTAVFVLARFCERNGLADMAGKLDLAAFSLRPRDLRPRDRPKEAQGGSIVLFDARLEPNPERFLSLRETIESELGWVLLRQTLCLFSDERVPRAEILAQFERLVRECPGMEEIEEAQKHVTTLRRMVADDLLPMREAKEIEALAPAAQAGEWVLQLRDQTEQKHGGFISGAKVSVLEPGLFVEEMPDYAREDRRPAQRILTLGHAAVPALIEALSDTRLTRTLQFYSIQPTLPTVLTVGDCAEEILEKISGRSFWWERVSAKVGPDKSTPADVRPAVEKWWKELNERGESAVMADAIRRGDHSSTEQARRLFPRDTAAAAAALPEGITNAETAYIREGLIEYLSRVPAAQSQPLLREELARGRWLQSRVAAARLHHELGGDEAVKAMLAEWHRWNPEPTKNDRHHNGDDVEPLVEFLVGVWHPDAIGGLASRFDSLPIWARVLILETIQSSSSNRLLRNKGPEAPGEQSAKRVAEKILLRALDDRSINTEINYGGDDDSTTWQARVCDYAAGALLPVRENKAVYGPGKASLTERDALIAELKGRTK